MIPGADHTHELVVIRPDDGRTLRWNTFRDRANADAERIKLAKIGMFAIVRRLADPPAEGKP